MVESNTRIRKRKVFHNIYSSLITIDNVFQAYYEFRKGKRNKKDVLEFEVNLEENLLMFYRDLYEKRYQHGRYHKFMISDPKPRVINKANVRDRIVHHLVAKKLEEMYEPVFIDDVYSSRKGKGVFRTIKKVQNIVRSVRKRDKGKYFILKCDIKKFFASVDHEVLKSILSKKIRDEKFFDLLEKIIDSFGIGIPLGNVTSQVLANVYLNELDQFVKHNLKIRKYVRYCDDLLLLVDKSMVKRVIDMINIFLEKELKLQLHPNKIVVRKINQGIDWLGFVIFSKYIKIGTKTKNRILRRCEKRVFNEDVSGVMSYFALLQHGNNYKVRQGVCRRVV